MTCAYSMDDFPPQVESPIGSDVILVCTGIYEWILVNPSVVISASWTTGDSLQGVLVSLSNGLPGEMLRVTDARDGIMWEWYDTFGDRQEPTLLLRGMAPVSSYEAALRSIQMWTVCDPVDGSSTNVNTTDGKEPEDTNMHELRYVVWSDTRFLPWTGHLYELVGSVWTDWDSALKMAQDIYSYGWRYGYPMGYYDMQGYLVTITSEIENEFIRSLLPAGENCWLGASEEEGGEEGAFIWACGPEKGSHVESYIFWNESASSSGDEFPNDMETSSLSYGWPSWSEIPVTTFLPYAVEYGGLPVEMEGGIQYPENVLRVWKFPASSECSMHGALVWNEFSDENGTCICSVGWMGPTCSEEGGTGDVCGQCDMNADCMPMSDGQFHCQCRPGFTGDGFSCMDVDECAMGLHMCGSGATCINEYGYYWCDCVFPYSTSEDGLHCECRPPSYGPDCSLVGDCLIHGTENITDEGECICNDYFSGPKCRDMIVNVSVSPESLPMDSYVDYFNHGDRRVVVKLSMPGYEPGGNILCGFPTSTTPVEVMEVHAWEVTSTYGNYISEYEVECYAPEMWDSSSSCLRGIYHSFDPQSDMFLRMSTDFTMFSSESLVRWSAMIFTDDEDMKDVLMLFSGPTNAPAVSCAEIFTEESLFVLGEGTDIHLSAVNVHDRCDSLTYHLFIS